MTTVLPYPDVQWSYTGPWIAPAKVLKVVDGDTFHPLINRGWYDTYRPKKGLRLLGIGGVPYDAPDLADDPAGQAAARRRLTLLLPAGLEVLIESWGLDAFGRTLASVQLPDGRDVAAVMTAYGHVKGVKWTGPQPDSLDPAPRVAVLPSCPRDDLHPRHLGCAGGGW